MAMLDLNWFNGACYASPRRRGKRAASGRCLFNSEAMNRALDLAGLVMGGTFGGVPDGAIGSGAVRRKTAK